jgi:hypothetical protein
MLKKELKAIDCVDLVPNLKRLEVYRTVFEMLIQEFKVYGPLLADIKVFQICE